MRPLLVSLERNNPLTKPIAKCVGAEHALIEVRRFPDGETYLRYDTDVSQRQVILLSSLDNPDSKFLRLAFAAATARDLGASSVGLVSPYLPYMRQDSRFQAGEAVSSICFAKQLSAQLDWLVTVDPHLHRHASLSDIFDIKAVAAHSAPLIANWIQQYVERPLLVGPDEESRQWVAAVAKDANAPHMVLQKTRRDDRDVEVSAPQLSDWSEYTPVLVDDIVSTARTMIVTIENLKRAGLRSPVCVGVHGLFVDDAYRDLVDAGAGMVVTSNTVPHVTNAIDVSGLLADAVRGIFDKEFPR
ncbi:Ribose-phosphate pyrophosphokinase [Roseibium album]|nr:Ribose-phosphate pyrophosphokinase [Roseibium album]